MKETAIFACAVIFVIAAAAGAFADSGGRIYGKITTVDGDVYQGLIRWDKNEGSWFDILNGDKELRDARHRRHYHERIRVFGITVGERFSAGDIGSAQSGLSFGHVKSLEPIDDNAVRLTLKSGQKVTLEGGSSDIGEDIRGIAIEDAKEGEIGFDWNDIERIEFMEGPADLKSTFGERLYGTLTTRRGDAYTGWVSWDVDELFTGDVIDGKDKNHTRKVPCGAIRAIERHGSSAAALTTAKGEEIVLRGTNDVNASNRGISVYEPGLGQVTVSWDEFGKLEFKAPPASIPYGGFDGGRRLEGTVYTGGGKQYSGAIRWDDDEEYTWEILDGDYHEASFDIEFGAIKTIERQGYNAAMVTMWNGRSFRLSGSNDVDEDNKGIFIKTNDGGEVEVGWEDLDRVEFKR
jgi:hypothetical protein